MLPETDIKKIKEMSQVIDIEVIAETYQVPVDVIEDIIKGNITGDSNAIAINQGTSKPNIKVVEKARFVRNKTVTAISPGGGRGKTSVLNSLAMLAAINSPGRRPILSLGLAEYNSMPLHFGINITDGGLLPSILQASKTPTRDEIFEFLSVEHLEIENLFLMPGVHVADRYNEITLDFVKTIIEAVQKYFEMVFVDTPARTDINEEIINVSDTILVICNNDNQSLEGMLQLLPTLCRLGKEQQSLLVINQLYPEGIKRGVFQKMLAEVSGTEIPVTAWIPQEKGLNNWLNRTAKQHPVLNNPGSEYTTQINNLLGQLCPDWKLYTTDSKKGLFRWLKR